MISHLLGYQGFAVDAYGFTLDVSNLGYPRFRSIRGKNIISFSSAQHVQSPSNSLWVSKRNTPSLCCTEIKWIHPEDSGLITCYLLNVVA